MQKSKTFALVVTSVLISAILLSAQTHSENSVPLDYVIENFVIENAMIVDGISALSLKEINGLHIAIEEVLKEQFSSQP